MIITKRGRKEKVNPVYFGRCTGCKCEFSAYESELSSTTDPKDGSRSWWVGCPEEFCNKTVVVEREEPSRVIARWQAR